jgi:hypothetical protein
MSVEIMEITKTEYDGFVDYCAKFYGEGQMYAQRDFATKAQIREATNIYLMSNREEFFVDLSDIDPTEYRKHKWGGGDTVDRETVAGILVNELGVDLY